MSMKEIRLKLFDFFDKYYSANIMTLSVISGYSLHKIESMIVKEFCQIRNKEIKLTKNYDDPFKNQLCTKWYLLDLEILHLTLSFPLPYLTDDCMTKISKKYNNL
ncbi:putative zinc protease mug138 [Pogonomyrmex barbatus]|uniref:Zinc protease mug138 n=1 Tax=Pogonomyrmex barbatus TaxID=144034 RepID=A0A6I9WD22_9HYME|nr:putative zinc protease mug138 [Pogonomyrmex barbatus]